MRKTIYLPDDLAQKVGDLNLSRICQRALRKALAERVLEEDALLTDIDAVAERLRASKDAEYDREHKEGFALSSRWAKQKASFSSLKWFTEQANRKSDSLFLNEDLLEFLGSHYGVHDNGEINMYWEFLEDARRSGDDSPHMRVSREDGFNAGLLAGAAEVWRLVLPKLEQEDEDE